MMIDHLMRRDGRSEESHLERRDMRTLSARRNYQTAIGKFLKFVKERALPLDEDVEIDGALVAYSNDFVQGFQHHHGSQLLATVMDRGRHSALLIQQTSEAPSMFEDVATAHTCAHPTSNACTSLGRHCNTTHPSQSHPHMAPFILILQVTYMRPSELLALRKKDLVPRLVPLLPCWSVVIAASTTGVFAKTGVRDGSVLMD